MIRAVLYIFLAIILISLLRSIVGIIGKVIAGAMEPAPGPSKSAGAAQAREELKRDPVCGVFVSESTSVKKTVGAETLHFCSPACRDKYAKG